MIILESKKGITLIALIITIIVLLILAGISISLVVGDNGVLTRAKLSKEMADLTQIQEEIQLAWSAVEAEGIPNKWSNETKCSALQTELRKTDSSATTSYTSPTITVSYKGYHTTINTNNNNITVPSISGPTNPDLPTTSELTDIEIETLQNNGMIEIFNDAITNSNLKDNPNIKSVIKGDGTEEIPIPTNAVYKEGTESTGIVIEYKGSEFVWIPIPINNRFSAKRNKFANG